MIRITVVDDHRIIYDGIKAMLIGVQDIAIADYVSDLSALSYSIDQHKPDIILMDIVLPSGSGIDATKEILTEHPDIKIIVLSSKEDEITIGEAIRAGAKCYLHKDTGKEEFELENIIENPDKSKNHVILKNLSDGKDYDIVPKKDLSPVDGMGAENPAVPPLMMPN